MDPLVSLYYFAPVCAVMNGAVALLWEVPKVSMADVYNVGLFTFFLNGLCALMLNVSVVFLVSDFLPLALSFEWPLMGYHRLARLLPLSSPSAVSSRTLCWLLPP
jgi:hypothetical protein